MFGPLPATPWRLVLDTNVVMALWHFRDPALALLWDGLAAGRLRAITRPDCLAELRRVLAYEQFRIDAMQQAAIQTDYAAHAECWPAASPAEAGLAAALPRCRDRDDQKFVALAWAADAACLVTRDKQLLKLARRPQLRERFMILTPERLCQDLRSLADAQALQEVTAP